MHSEETLKAQAEAASNGPDFLCIGMGKSGTGWLYVQLNHHPDFWMPPIKEMHYLDRPEPRMGKLSTYVNRRRVNGEIPRRYGRKSFKKKEIEFLEEAHAHIGKPMNLDFYGTLFRYKEGLLSGDVTPSYCALPEDQIAKIICKFPRLKIILLVRDPVSRAWSHFTMRERARTLRGLDILDPVEFRKELEESRAVRTGRPATFAKTWLKHVPVNQFRHYFFEDLVSDPVGLLRQILEFLGADPNKEIPPNAAENSKARTNLKITPEIQAILVEKFTPELIECAQVFGGHATTWAANYGVRVP